MACEPVVCLTEKHTYHRSDGQSVGEDAATHFGLHVPSNIGIMFRVGINIGSLNVHHVIGC